VVSDKMMAKDIFVTGFSKKKCSRRGKLIYKNSLIIRKIRLKQTNTIKQRGAI
jgi:hypothetical protein